MPIEGGQVRTHSTPYEIQMRFEMWMDNLFIDQVYGYIAQDNTSCIPCRRDCAIADILYQSALIVSQNSYTKTT